MWKELKKFFCETQQHDECRTFYILTDIDGDVLLYKTLPFGVDCKDTEFHGSFVFRSKADADRWRTILTNLTGASLNISRCGIVKAS
jgi:hypothetical protein